ncbi:hypothetical protein, conserved [Eimeria brunetti]|uniref:Uncharacterized protein n=1 Tax=Eimeria brunetti TaxID=51314 RepID=U6LR62_9EIME|nr:hypothetical protein, conserved [Eimeria brunetti]
MEGRDTANADEKLAKQAPFGYTLVAGTFDRLHAGHQLLLAAAALSARQRIGLAVASGPLVEKKAASEQDVAGAGVEPFACRLKSAAAFVQLLAASRGKVVRLTGFREALWEEATSLSEEPQLQFSLLGGSNEFGCGSRPAMEANTEGEAVGDSLQLHIFRITDAVGPADRLAFDCLVVSAETLKGASKVNSIRVEAGNDPVFVLSVGLVPADAGVLHQAAGVVAAYLPFPLVRGANQPEQKAELSRLEGGGSLSKYLVQQKAPVAAEEKDFSSSVPQKYKNSTHEPLDAFRNKLSSTALRQQQVKWLGCGSIAELCKRFRSAWLWLEGNEGVGSTKRQLCSTMWNVLCAEHAAPWRRLHTFDRVARSLKRLDASEACVKRELIVLSVFLGSLLASPCHYITVARRACAASDSRDSAEDNDANSCTLASWSPEAEDAAWQISATKLLAGLQCKWELRPSAAEQNGGRGRGKLPETSTIDPGSVLLEGQFSVLMGLLLEQRAATHTRLASTGQAVSALRGRRAVAWGDGESATMVRLTRRLEQLEFTDRSVEEATRLQRLQQEYFFVSKDCFRTYRMKQLAQLLENANSLDCLDHEELVNARTNIELELDMLARQS